MTPQEKQAQAERLLPIFVDYGLSQIPKYAKIFHKATRFPCIVVLPEHEFEGYGKWHVVLSASTKKYFRKGFLNAQAYQKFYVRSKNPMNSGTGIYLVNHFECDGAQLYEYPPHYFSRFRERYMDKKGVYTDFNGLVKEVLRTQIHSVNHVIEGEVIRGEDGMYDIVKDNVPQYKKGYDNFANFREEGISFGIHVDEYYNFTTFVDNSLLSDSQKNFKKEVLDELRAHDFAHRDYPNERFTKIKYTDNVEF